MINRSMLEFHLTQDLGAVEPPCSDFSLSAIRRYVLSQTAFKKFRTSLEDPVASSAAVDLFLKMNNHCNDYYYCERSIYEESTFDKIREKFNFQFNPLYWGSTEISFDRILANANVGPGACRGSESYNFYTKLFDSTLTATSPILYTHYRRYLDRYHKRWYEAEMLRHSRFGDNIIESSRVTTVPKTVDISRTIATEPNLNMFYQKGLSSLFESRLWQDHSIDLAHQPDLNRARAREGSIDGSYATIDLKSASDSISLKLLERILPVKLYQLLQQIRSSSTILPDGRVVELSMLSSMGNGFTFSFQTLLFANLVEACYQTLGLPRFRNGRMDYLVFGDDIIVHKNAYNYVCQILEACGFIVNNTKSFNAGPFRESCGSDFWNGNPVRGIYIKKLETQSDINVARNQLYKFSLEYGINLDSTLRYFDSFKETSVPFWFDPSGGFYVTAEMRSTDTRTFKARVPIPHSKKYKDLAVRGINPDGLIVAFLGGYLSNDRITLRSNVPRTRLRTYHHISLMKDTSPLKPDKRKYYHEWDDLYLISKVSNDPRSLISSADLTF